MSGRSLKYSKYSWTAKYHFRTMYINKPRARTQQLVQYASFDSEDGCDKAERRADDLYRSQAIASKPREP